MPFPLAHPAAVLPLKALCGRFLRFPALVIGSITPDVGYCFGHDVESFSHSLIGLIIFCLPVGLLMVAAWTLVRGRQSPSSLQYSSTPKSWTKIKTPSLAATVTSILVGAWTHIFWDAFTNKNGWVVMRLPFLQRQIATFFNHPVKVCHVVWYLSSLFGVAILCREYWHWRWKQTLPETPVSSPASVVSFQRGPGFATALIYGAMIVPIGMVHHMTEGWFGGLLVAVLTLAFICVAARPNNWRESSTAN